MDQSDKFTRVRQSNLSSGNLKSNDKNTLSQFVDCGRSFCPLTSSIQSLQRLGGSHGHPLDNTIHVSLKIMRMSGCNYRWMYNIWFSFQSRGISIQIRHIVHNVFIHFKDSLSFWSMHIIFFHLDFLPPHSSSLCMHLCALAGSPSLKSLLFPR